MKPTNRKRAPQSTKARQQASTSKLGEEHGRPASGKDDSAPSQPDRPERTPREGSKKALVLALLQRPGGATLEEIVTATGWLPHTTRAALTGIRKKGVGVERSKGEDGLSKYRIPGSPDTGTAPADADREA